MRERLYANNMLKRVTVNAIQVIDNYPVVGERCKLRLWTNEGVVDIRTSRVTSWYRGYPNAVGGIQIETENTIYSGSFDVENAFA